VKSSPESAHTVHTVPPQTQPDVHVYGMNVQGWIKARHCDCQEAKKWQEWNKDIQRSRGARRVGRAKIVVVIGTNPGALIFVDFDSSHPKICPMILVLAFFSLEPERHRYGFAWDVQAPEYWTNHYPDWQETDVTLWLHLRNSQKRRKPWYSRKKWPILMICLCLFGGPMGSPVLRTSQLDSKSQKIRHPQSATAESPLFEANSLEKQNLRVINKVSSRFCVVGWFELH
jgi:hypothetical protein